MTDDSNYDTTLQHTCRSVKDVIVTLNGVTLEGADAVMFTPPASKRAASDIYGAILSSDDTFNRAFEWQAAQKHTDVQHMNADISISGIFSCKATGGTSRWTLHNIKITDVNRDVDLLEPGTDVYQFQAIADET